MPPLEQVVVDLVRAGTRGQGAGVRKVASRLMRQVPQDVTDAPAFRSAIHDALARPGEVSVLVDDLPVEADTRRRLVSVVEDPDADGLALNTAIMDELEEVVAERERATELRLAGVEPSRTVLLSGPPGVGKTMSAAWLARRLGLPLVVLDLATVVSSYLGSSGRNIRETMDFAQSGRCVLLLDEFDAIAKRRDDSSDIGELRRVVNVMLAELDRWPATSLLVAATNHEHLLDPAVFRRFEHVVRYELPDRATRERQLRLLARGRDVDDEILALLAEVSEGASGASLAQMWMVAVRRSVLRASSIDHELLREATRGHQPRSESMERLCYVLAYRLGMSRRQIGKLCGLSHTTVGARIDSYRRRVGG